MVSFSAPTSTTEQAIDDAVKEAIKRDIADAQKRKSKPYRFGYSLGSGIGFIAAMCCGGFGLTVGYYLGRTFSLWILG